MGLKISALIPLLWALAGCSSRRELTDLCVDPFNLKHLEDFKMNKLMVIAIFASYAVLTVSPAQAISEGYRKQLEREHKTQVQDLSSPLSKNGFNTYSDNFLDVQVSSDCHVKTINGFPPLKTTKIGENLYEVKTRLNITLSILKQKDACAIAWSSEDGQSGILKMKG